MFRWFSKCCLFLTGWKAVGEFPKEIAKYIVIMAPHTSAWDFVIGILFRSVLRLNKSHYLGKKELFKPPFGFIFRWFGGYPVDRSSSHNMVDEVVKIFNAHREFVIALSPEGTRKKVERLRTGFYNIAKKARVPIVMVGFDYRNKQAVISEPYTTTENEQLDLEHILTFFRPIEGKYPGLGLSHL